MYPSDNKTTLPELRCIGIKLRSMSRIHPFDSEGFEICGVELELHSMHDLFTEHVGINR